MNKQDIDILVSSIVKSIKKDGVLQIEGSRCLIPVEASGRHLHLSKKDVEELFGAGYQLQNAKNLSQPGQFLCVEKVTLMGPNGMFKNVGIIGPERSNTQVEISKTDARALGLNPPINLSGNLNGALSVIVANGEKTITAKNCVIIAKAHIHLSEDEATKCGVKDGMHVRAKIEGLRPVSFDDVIIRAGKMHKMAMHIDYDEANAANWCKSTVCSIIGNSNSTEIDTPSIQKNHIINAADCEFSLKGCITEHTLSDVYKKGGRKVYMQKGCILTPLAKDYLRLKDIKAVWEETK